MLKDFIINELLKTQDVRVIDVTFSRQFSVLGFGENKETLYKLALKYGVSKESIRRTERINRDRINHRLNYIMEQKVKVVTVYKDAPKQPNALLAELKIYDLPELSVRAQNCFINSNIKYVSELEALSDADLLKIPNLGRKSVREVREKIKQLTQQLEQGQ